MVQPCVDSSTRSQSCLYTIFFFSHSSHCPGEKLLSMLGSTSPYTKVSQYTSFWLGIFLNIASLKNSH